MTVKTEVSIRGRNHVSAGLTSHKILYIHGIPLAHWTTHVYPLKKKE